MTVGIAICPILLYIFAIIANTVNGRYCSEGRRPVRTQRILHHLGPTEQSRCVVRIVGEHRHDGVRIRRALAKAGDVAEIAGV